MTGLGRTTARRYRPVIAALATAWAAVTGGAPAAACDICYGATNDSPLLTSARLGVFLLLGVTVSVLGGFVAFIVYLRNRARQFESETIASEWAQLQRSPHP